MEAEEAEEAAGEPGDDLSHPKGRPLEFTVSRLLVMPAHDIGETAFATRTLSAR